MLPVNLTQTTIDDIQQLIKTSISESKTLEYKAEMYPLTTSGYKELCKDLSAFGNVAGGDLIIGVREDIKEEARGKPAEISPIVDHLYQELRGTITQVASSHIQPKLNLEFHEIEVPGYEDTGGFVLVIRVKKSINSPHMVKFDHSVKFFTRTSHGVQQIVDVGELRQAFLASEMYEERMRRWINERLTIIESNHTPVPILASDRLVMHLIPIQEFVNRTSLDIFNESREVIFPLGGNGVSPRVNFDGKLFASQAFQEGNRSYTQLFKYGMIEALWSGITFSKQDSKQKDYRQLRVHGIETLIVERLPQYIDHIIKAGATYPVLVNVTLLNVYGICAHQSYLDELSEPNINMQDNLYLPDVIINSESESITELMKPIFDSVWNAIGYPESPSYRDGEWNPKLILR